MVSAQSLMPIRVRATLPCPTSHRPQVLCLKDNTQSPLLGSMGFLQDRAQSAGVQYWVAAWVLRELWHP